MMENRQKSWSTKMSSKSIWKQWLLVRHQIRNKNQMVIQILKFLKARQIHFHMVLQNRRHIIKWFLLTRNKKLATWYHSNQMKSSVKNMKKNSFQSRFKIHLHLRKSKIHICTNQVAKMIITPAAWTSFWIKKWVPLAKRNQTHLPKLKEKQKYLYQNPLVMRKV